MAKNKEQYIAVCKQHWIAFWKWALAEILLLALAIVSLFFDKLRGASGPLFCAALAFAVIAILYIVISYKTTYIALTGTKIIGHIGFIRSKTLMTPLSKIQNVGISNGLLGKILKYHTVTLSDAGGSITEYVFKKMAHAREFADAVHAAMEKGA